MSKQTLLEKDSRQKISVISSSARDGGSRIVCHSKYMLSIMRPPVRSGPQRHGQPSLETWCRAPQRRSPPGRKIIAPASLASPSAGHHLSALGHALTISRMRSFWQERSKFTPCPPAGRLSWRLLFCPLSPATANIRMLIPGFAVMNRDSPGRSSQRAGATTESSAQSTRHAAGDPTAAHSTRCRCPHDAFPSPLLTLGLRWPKTGTLCTMLCLAMYHDSRSYPFYAPKSTCTCTVRKGAWYLTRILR